MKKNIGVLLWVLIFFIGCKPDACEEVGCLNGGSCEKGICQCLSGFNGPDCSFLVASRFTGNYNTTYDCTSAALEVSIELKPGDNKRLITLRNLGDYACPENYWVEALTSGDSLYINRQQVCAGSLYEFQGYGILKPDSIVLYYTVTYPSNPGTITDVCSATLIKIP